MIVFILEILMREKNQLIVFTDIGRDHDDEVALILMSGLLKIGAIDVKAIITTLQPALKRAQLARRKVKKQSLKRVMILIFCYNHGRISRRQMIFQAIIERIDIRALGVYQ